MALFKVLETSFIGLKLCQVDEIVEINTDLEKGGMTPGPNLGACDEEGNLIGAPKAKPKAKVSETV